MTSRSCFPMNQTAMYQTCFNLPPSITGEWNFENANKPTNQQTKKTTIMFTSTLQIEIHFMANSCKDSNWECSLKSSREH